MENVQAQSYAGFGDARLEVLAEANDYTLAVAPTHLSGHRVHSWHYRFLKRGLDLAGASVMLGLALIPGLLIAATIAATSKGPIFYREPRVGRGGRLFRIWKFRSMCAEGSPADAVWADRDCTKGTLLQWRIEKRHGDPRITPFGGFLRRWSLDELPQVLNVLMGDMSLIGPRPVVEAEVEMYEHLRHYYLAAAPGMSGLWQVSGRSNVDFASRADLDARYVMNWSLRSDFVILAKTIPAVLGRVGAR